MVPGLMVISATLRFGVRGDPGSLGVELDKRALTFEMPPEVIIGYTFISPVLSHN